jgi:hypothetical protein
MAAYPNSDPLNTPGFEALRKYLENRRGQAVGEPGQFEEHEKELHRLMSVCEAELLAGDLGRHDIDAPYIEVDGVRYRKALRAGQNYTGQAGQLRVERNLYEPVGGGRTICPLELRAGIVEGAWTPHAARIMTLMVAEVPPNDAEGLIAQFGGMTPSASSLDRLPKLLSERWEENRIDWERALRDGERVPSKASMIAVSIDGVHVPLKKKELKEKDQAENASKYREAGCGTVTYLDRDGNRLRTVRFARMPQEKKKILKAQLTAEFESAMKQKPGLTVVKIADGAGDNWEFLRGLAGRNEAEILDFYHATTHLKSATDAVYGAETPESKALFEVWKATLKEDPEGADKVIRAVAYRRDQAAGNSKKILEKELKFFRSMRDGMQYQAFREEKMPIGSGLVEAACKTLVSERLKQSGMRWTLRGGQGILTLRSLVQSERFESGWRLLSRSYHSEVRRAG